MAEETVCKHCNTPGSLSFCAACGTRYVQKRITVSSIFHEAFHFFTHLDKGFPYTLKKLVKVPGTMQREYLEGERSRHQKPFSMFFLCITFTALALYWINKTVVARYGVGDGEEVSFFHQYMVMLQVLMIPVYSLIVYLFFIRSGYNYAEVVVMQLYAFSMVFIVLILIHLLKFPFPHIETRYIEVPFIIIYALLTNLNFFRNERRWVVVAKSILSTAAIYAVAAIVQDTLVKILAK